MFLPHRPIAPIHLKVWFIVLASTFWAIPTAASPQLCTAPVPQFAVDYRQPEVPRFDIATSDQDAYYLAWGETFQTTIAQQGYSAALRSLRSRPPIEQAGTLLGTVVRSGYEGDRNQFFTDIVKILRPVDASPQRDRILYLVAVLALEQNQLSLAIDAARSVSDLDIQLETYSQMSSDLRRLNAWERAAQVDEAAYQSMTTQPAYRAAVLSRLGSQYHQILQPEIAQRFFAQANAQLNQARKQREAGLQFVSRELMANQNLALALPLISQMQDPEQPQLAAAIVLAQQGKINDSVELAIQAPMRSMTPELQRLVDRLITADQLNCAMQVTFLPIVKESILEQILPILVSALIQAKRDDEVLQILKHLEQDNPWQMSLLADVLAPALVRADRPEIILNWALSLQEPSVRFDVLITLAKAFAQHQNRSLATQSLEQVKQLFPTLLAVPVPSSTPAPFESPPDQNKADRMGDYEADARRARQVRYFLTLAPVYQALGESQTAIALLQEALKIIFSPDEVDFIIGSEYEQITPELFSQYHSLIDSQQAIAELNTRYQSSLRLPDSATKTRHLRSIAEQFAHLGFPDRALQMLPFQTLSASTQQQIILTLAQQKQFEQALSLARQVQETGIYDRHHPLETWVQLSAELAIAGQTAPSETVFMNEVLPRITGQQSYPSEEWIQAQLPQWSRFYAEKKLYPLAQRLILQRYQAPLDYFPVTKPDHRDLRFPLLPLNQILLDTAKIAVINGDTAQSFALIQAIPLPLDRARCLAQLAIDLDTMGYADLATQAIQAADQDARSLPSHIGKAQVLLEINQVQIQNGQAAQIGDRLAEIARILK
jgi:tetratricopeptide (TPR) repeat protein